MEAHSSPKTQCLFEEDSGDVVGWLGGSGGGGLPISKSVWEIGGERVMCSAALEEKQTYCKEHNIILFLNFIAMLGSFITGAFGQKLSGHQGFRHFDPNPQQLKIQLYSKSLREG